MKNRLLIIFFIIGTYCFGQNNQTFQDDYWTQEIQRDDFGDLENYYYIEMSGDKFNYNDIIIKLQYNGLSIYQGTNPQNFIKYKKAEAPYTLKIKSGNDIYNDKTDFIGRKGFLIFEKYSKLYKLITSGKGKWLSIVIYNNQKERINSFDLFTFKPIFK